MLNNQECINGLIVFVYNGGTIIKKKCKINLVTLEVFNFDLTDVFNKNLKLLNQEYLEINGTVWDVYGTSERILVDTDFWYNDL